MTGKARWKADDYMETGKKYYRLAAEHPTAKTLRVAEVCMLFHDNLRAAQKPLNFIVDRYLDYNKHSLFGAG